MNPFFRTVPGFVRRLALALAVGLAAPALAGPGHEGGHDHDEAPIVTSGAALPRFEAHSDLFEVVGTLRGGELALTLDDYATNAPVAGARVELESGSYRSVGEPVEAGSYRFGDTPFAAPGTYPVMLTVSAGDDVDLLAADLVVAAPAVDAATGSASLRERLLWGAGGVLALVTLGLGVRARLQRRPRPGA
ncbi:hypothetical protein [Aromatoleum anaerobium]|uniref:Uncharacterized protein n=1 Tax=Aromatoleum anaerobium TaxID=182180 RepID=A0ABX1PLG1_9RHOO|nr:hypothetical protein [Aromatoleum anaerobium]MCK0506490.1 hypothetical protein [Aromatoleum anaerobium]